MLSYPEIDPVIFTINLHYFSIPIRWYSLMYVIGFFVVTWFLRASSKRKTLQLTKQEIESVMVYGFFGLIIGARLFYVLFYNLSDYIKNPWTILKTWEGGLSFHGAITGICVAVYLFARKYRRSFLNITDHVSLAAPVGLGLGRIGNFINGELWGRATDVPWAMVFPHADHQPRHPSQLYESFFEGPFLLLCLFIVYRRSPTTGVLTGIFAILYGFMRFFIEFFREPDRQLGFVLGPFSMGQLLSMAMWAVGAFILIYARDVARKQYN